LSNVVAVQKMKRVFSFSSSRLAVVLVLVAVAVVVDVAAVVAVLSDCFLWPTFDWHHDIAADSCCHLPAPLLSLQSLPSPSCNKNQRRLCCCCCCCWLKLNAAAAMSTAELLFIFLL